MRDGGVVKGIPSTGSRKTCMMKAVLIGLMTFCLSADADTIDLEFGVVNVEGSTKRWFDSDGTLNIEVSDPYPVKVTIDPKEYDYNGKHYAWSVNPSKFHVAGKSTVVCNATLCEDGVSEDTRRVLFVPWVKIDVSNVVLHSPNPEKGWPYDPVYDDPIWEMTVRGDLSAAAASNTDKAPVSYVLNKPATSVKIVPYQSTWKGKKAIASRDGFDGTINAGRNKVDAWLIKNQDKGNGYFVEVTAYGDRGDVDSDQSQKVGIKREKYYTQFGGVGDGPDKPNPPNHPDLMEVSYITEIAPDDFGLGVKIAGSVLAVTGLLPGGSIPSAIMSLALTWSPSSTPDWLEDKCMVVMHGPWQMSMHTWESNQYVIKDDKSESLGGYSYCNRGTFSVSHECGYKDGWYVWVCEHGEMPVNDLQPSDVNAGLSAKSLFDGFVSDYRYEINIDPLGGGAHHHWSEGDGPILGEGFFTERKVDAPWLKWVFEPRKIN